MTGPVSPDPAVPGPPAALGAYEEELLALARWAIDRGFAGDREPEPDPAGTPEPLREPGAAFVTLRRGGDLRGCLGSIEAHRPLGADIAANAFGAAFRDPRFSAVTPPERAEIDLKVEVLGPPEPLSFRSEAELLGLLEPGRDGLILEAGSLAGTFLPSVWENLPEPERFLSELRRKAGLPRELPAAALTVRRFRTATFPAPRGGRERDGR